MTADHKTRARAGCFSFAMVPVLLIVGTLAVYIRNNKAVSITVPPRVVPSPNGYDDFVRAGVFSGNMKNVCPADYFGPTPYTFANLKAFAAESRPVLAAVQLGLSHKCMGPTERTVGAMSYKTLGKVRECARALSGIALYDDEIGDYDAAADARLDAIEMGVRIAGGAPLILQLVSVAVQAIGTTGLERDFPQLTSPELAHVAARLDQINAARTNFGDTLSEEAYVQLAATREIVKHPEMVEQLEPITAGNGVAVPRWRHTLNALLFKLANKQAIIRDDFDYMKRVSAECRGPYSTAIKATQPDNLIIKSFADVLEPSWADTVVAETRGTILRTEVAIYQYHADRASYPPSLAALIPTYLPKVPSDPFGGASGASLRYSTIRNKTAFLLYSVGPDMRDNGGKPTTNWHANSGDIVAGQFFNHKVQKFPR